MSASSPCSCLSAAPTADCGSRRGEGGPTLPPPAEQLTVRPRRAHLSVGCCMSLPVRPIADHFLRFHEVEAAEAQTPGFHPRLSRTPWSGRRAPHRDAVPCAPRGLGI